MGNCLFHISRIVSCGFLCCRCCCHRRSDANASRNTSVEKRRRRKNKKSKIKALKVFTIDDNEHDENDAKMEVIEFSGMHHMNEIDSPMSSSSSSSSSTSSDANTSTHLDTNNTGAFMFQLSRERMRQKTLLSTRKNDKHEYIMLTSGNCMIRIPLNEITQEQYTMLGKLIQDPCHHDGIMIAKTLFERHAALYSNKEVLMVRKSEISPWHATRTDAILAMAKPSTTSSSSITSSKSGI